MNVLQQDNDFEIKETLLTPFFLSDSLKLKNRIVMAPMTRSMASDSLVPTEESARYYGRRSDAGLIITEATIVRSDGQGYPNTPGIYTQDQVKGWSRVTDEVHRRGGRIFLQLWHVGRVSHPVYLNGELPIAPSAVPLEGSLPRHRDLQYGSPRALMLDEIQALEEAFAQGAAGAQRAGFDGVEIHGANGYLIDQFLHYHTNRRSDAYGGSPENMARFALEIVDAASAEIGAERVGIRLSPGAYVHMNPSPDDASVFKALLRSLESRQLAYVHTGIFDDSTSFDYLHGTAGAFLRRHFRGTLMGNGGYTLDKAALALRDREFDLVSIGRPFIANPDLIGRLKAGLPFKTYEESMLTQLY